MLVAAVMVHARLRRRACFCHSESRSEEESAACHCGQHSSCLAPKPGASE